MSETKGQNSIDPAILQVLEVAKHLAVQCELGDVLGHIINAGRHVRRPGHGLPVRS